ncbi:MAG: alpha amylase, catalytic subdomain [Micavibrio sp.]|nr:alpha amylase, catalytic subdomain [Micavibrio sp.]
MTATTPTPRSAFSSDPLWFKDAVIYQLHVRAFCDSNGDGIGDFRGLLQKIDYLRDLGVNTIWLLPFYPSPLKDDGYDISDYRSINKDYGDLDDFREFIEAAHSRGMRVITELVINHTSDQHEWFQRARRDKPDGYWRNFYVWTDDPKKYKEARIIFRDFEPSNWSYDPVAKAYYWHRFFSHQPDLNFDNPEVKKAILELVDFWMDMSVDGMRLDAVPYLYERDGTSCENLPETHEFLKELRAYIDEHYEDRVLLAEANQWPEDAVTYFGKGDECQMNFHFPIMPRLFMAIKREDSFSIIDILNQTPDIPDTCQWAMFLRNHDELTLEMVTDEERDYMYNAYASDKRARINLGIRRRLAPLLLNDRRQIELMNGLLFSMPGTPIIYYGDEIGMGDNIYIGDRNGVRTPFQWSPDRNAGFSKADPQSLYLPVIMTPEYHYTTINVETQKANPNSLLQWMQGLIALRQQNTALGRGRLDFLHPKNEKVLAFIRDYESPDGNGSQKILVLANLSKCAQYVELDLSRYKGLVPLELRGGTPFPAIGDLPYLVTLGPYDFYWFDLTDPENLNIPQPGNRAKVTQLPSFSEILEDNNLRLNLERQIQDYLPSARWFGGKARAISRVLLRDLIRLDDETAAPVLAIVEIQYSDQRDRPDIYLIGLSRAEGEKAVEIAETHPEAVIAAYDLEDGQSALYYDSAIDMNVPALLVNALRERRRLPGRQGRLDMATYKEILSELPAAKSMGVEQSNSAFRFDHAFFLKLFRRLDEGVNPEIEIGQHLTEKNFKAVPHMMGSISYTTGHKSYSVAVLHEFIESKGTAWDMLQERLEAFSSITAEKGSAEAETILKSVRNIYNFDAHILPEWFVEAAGDTAEMVKLLGRRTGEMHLALASGDGVPDFLPENTTPFHQRALYQSLRNGAVRTRNALTKQGNDMPEGSRALADQLLERWDVIDHQLNTIRQRLYGGQFIRIHGDYHLGQIMFTGGDFIILDFEGEPMRPISTRRLKRSPLVDVAGLLRSLDYAVHVFVTEHPVEPRLMPWLNLWQLWMGHNYLSGYLEVCAGTALLPEGLPEIRYLTEVFLLEKVLYEINYELSSRPDWVAIPLQGILDLLPRLSSSEVRK